ncbi:MAG: GspE/PulE family protein [Deltaproteobacteria bacterium]|nr:GspE/PulE family protein [Deltaproteobacteria bacterium]MBN2686676.1 GspE/PulE family protein [Deltaproteobacteria bacterium]
MSVAQPSSKVSGNLERSQITELEEKLKLQRAVHDITNRIHSAQNIKQIIVDLKDGILNLFDAYLITIYVADNRRNEIYSMFLAGSTLNEIRVPINNKSIAGYVANNKKVVNIADAYDDNELKKIDKALNFDRSWDQKSGLRTAQILAAPILYNEELMGVIQILNKKGGGAFTSDDQAFLEQIGNVIGIAFYNQERIRRKKKSKFDYLLRIGLIKDEELETAYEEARKNKQTTEDYLMAEHKIPRAEIGKSLQEFFNCRYTPFNDKIPIPFDLLRSLKEEYLRRELWVPLERKDGRVKVLVDDPNNILKRDMIESLLKTSSVEYDVALYDEILQYINYFYQSATSRESISDLVGKLDEEEFYDEDEDGVLETDSIIMQLVNKIINDAYSRGASDIHVEPSLLRKNVEIRMRVDGELRHYQAVPFSYRSAIVSRIKIMSNLDITERRIPQDGKIKFRRSNGESIELRVATVPTQGGVEDVVMRVLAKGETLPLDAMGFTEYTDTTLKQLLVKPYGMILVVGPTGSGKTTTLHAALGYINKPETKIWTAEDPVEITQQGLRQVQIHPKIGFDFATAMRAFLRADPDVIMVGEMRDYETAKTGVEASLTGHLVFSTLHTNSAPETVVRLLDMGIDPLNFADSMLGILAQRLARTLCKKCKEEYHPTNEEFDEMVRHYGEEHFKKLGVTYDDNFKLFRAKGCKECNDTGYKGRMGLYELLAGSDTIKRAIQQKKSAEELRDIAIEEGMDTLMQDGIKKVISGKTDLYQVLRVCMK